MTLNGKNKEEKKTHKTHTQRHTQRHTHTQRERESALTFPQLYKFGLNLTVPWPVVVRFSRGGEEGYVSGQKRSNTKHPNAYGDSLKRVDKMCVCASVCVCERV